MEGLRLWREGSGLEKTVVKADVKTRWLGKNRCGSMLGIDAILEFVLNMQVCIGIKYFSCLSWTEED